MSGAAEQPDLRAVMAPLLSGVHEDVNLPGVVLHELEVAKAAPQPPLKASRFTIDAGCGTPEDQHAVHELWFIGQGKLDVNYDGTWHAVAKGDVLYFSPWKTHCSKNAGTEQVMVFSVWWP